MRTNKSLRKLLRNTRGNQAVVNACTGAGALAAGLTIDEFCNEGMISAALTANEVPAEVKWVGGGGR